MHTPGPWEYGNSHWGRWQISTVRDGKGQSFNIGELASYSGLGGREVGYNRQQEANARLIAAAPELLAALTILLTSYRQLVDSGDCGSWDSANDDEVKQAIAAIAKATEPRP